MPGYLEHTNEVLVPLGLEMFAWKSNKQALESLSRQIDSTTPDQAQLLW